MQRVTVSLDEGLAQEFDQLLAERGLANRSEGLREVLRSIVEQRRQEASEGPCAASFSYVFQYRQRQLAERLASLQHDNHDIIVAATRALLDHDHCLETVLMRGPISDVRRVCDQIAGERGVRFAAVNVISLEGGMDEDAHRSAWPHAHFTPRPG